MHAHCSSIAYSAGEISQAYSRYLELLYLTVTFQTSTAAIAYGCCSILFAVRKSWVDSPQQAAYARVPVNKQYIAAERSGN